MIGEIVARLGDIVYSTVGESLPETCARMLTDDRLTLAVAESCTGGLVASELVAIPGCSKFLLEGCVAYSDEAKMRRLGVKTETLARSARSAKQCAREMAEGMRANLRRKLCAGDDGLCGPRRRNGRKPGRHDLYRARAVKATPRSSAFSSLASARASAKSRRCTRSICSGASSASMLSYHQKALILIGKKRCTRRYLSCYNGIRVCDHLFPSAGVNARMRTCRFDCKQHTR